MPTPEQLSIQGVLKRWPHHLALGKQVLRDVYVTLGAGTWISEELKTLKTDGFYEGALSPREQLADVSRRVMVGEQIDQFRPKTIVKHPDWIHELRTPDLRIFGWFWRQRCYIASVLATKASLVESIKYSGCIETVRFERAKLDLDPPKFIEGEIDDILRIRN